MRRADYPQALMRAAEPALAAIEADALRAPRRLRPVFSAIVELIFELDLDLERIQAAAGIVDPNVFFDLRQEVGQPAWTYIRDARLETAARLLLITPIALSEIGRMVGYGSSSTFRRTLRGFLGMSASQYRRQAPRRLERAGQLPDGAQTDTTWQRMLAGELSNSEAQAFDTYLERLAPASLPATEPAEVPDRWSRLRQTLAEGLAEILERLPLPEQRRLVRDAVWFPDGTFFARLSDLGKQADRPERGVELALLGIDSLAANGMLETHPGRAALAWARLTLARWRAGDLPGAARDLGRSMHDTERGQGLDHTAAEIAECGRVQAAFHWFQGRRHEALEWIDEALAAHRVAGLDGLHRPLILRAELRAATSDLDQPVEPRTGSSEERSLDGALADLEEARDLLADAPEDEQTEAFDLWLRILVLLDDRAEKLVALPRARLWAAGQSDHAMAVLTWFEGHCSATGEPLWRQAREHLMAIGDELWAARVTLDLARACLADERMREAAGWASEVVSTVGTRVADREDLTALKALGAATAIAKVAWDDLDRVERMLKRLEWDRQASRALRLAL